MNQTGIADAVWHERSRRNGNFDHVVIGENGFVLNILGHCMFSCLR